jgi:RES domain-containing protein
MDERRDRYLRRIEQVEPRRLTGTCWRQTAPRYPLSSLPPAGTGGRYDREGGPPVLYASQTRRGAWAELYRHHAGSDVDVSLIRRRFGAVHIAGLRVLDLADPDVRAAVGVCDDDLLTDDYTLCHDLADAARAAGLDGLRVPSGALPGTSNIVVFDHAARTVVADEGTVRRAPASLAAVAVDIPFRRARTFRQAVARLPWRQRLRIAWSLLRHPRDR